LISERRRRGQNYPNAISLPTCLVSSRGFRLLRAKSLTDYPVIEVQGASNVRW
jgi:hypothetical protein